MRSGVRAGVETVVFLLDGNLCEVTLPLDPEDTGHQALPTRIRDGIARRRVLIETGECPPPCGREARPGRPVRRGEAAHGQTTPNSRCASRLATHPAAPVRIPGSTYLFRPASFST